MSRATVGGRRRRGGNPGLPCEDDRPDCVHARRPAAQSSDAASVAAASAGPNGLRGLIHLPFTTAFLCTGPNQPSTNASTRSQVGAYNTQGQFMPGFPAWLYYYKTAVKHIRSKLPFGGNAQLTG